MVELTALLTPVLEQILNRVITLFNGKIKIAVEIKNFSFAEMVTNYEDDGFYNSLLVLIEVTNSSDRPYHISSFSLKLNDLEFTNLFIEESERNMANGNLLDITTGDKSSAMFDVKMDISKALWRPYLQTNQSELGLVVFKFPRNLKISNDSTFNITAKIGGYDKLISEKIN